MSKYCYNIENSLSFNYQGLTFCNTLFKNPNYFEYKKGYLDRFLDHRKKVIEKLNNDEVDEYTCPATCMYLKNSDELVKTDSKFKYFEIYHWYQCNCACFYCSNSSTSKLEITKKRVKGVIDVLPALKELKKEI